ncbi:MAG TPA: rhomboid family intramembrane serine protease [Candidatus Angelobacter sp.]|nr:rhomboid family intramembrane serine protease [Candidatus Angelobacter sp.]
MPSCLKCGTPLPVNEDGGAPVLCDRCAGAATGRARRAMAMGNAYKFPATTTLVTINSLVFIGMVLTGGSLQSFSGELLIHWGGNYGPLTISGEYWRLLTAGFVHANFFHFAFNMWGLWNLGRLAERLFGKWQTFLIYLLTGMGGALLSIAYNHHRLSVGASGAIFGIAGAILVGIKFGEVPISAAEKKATVSSLILVVILNFSMGLGGSIDNMCHLGGFVTGLLVGLPLGAFMRNKLLQVATLVVTAAVLVAGALELVEKNGAEADKGAAILAWQQKDYARAVHLLEKYTVARPEDDDGLVMLGEAYLNNNEPDKAISALEQALRVNPNSEAAKQDLEELQSRQPPAKNK